MKVQIKEEKEVERVSTEFGEISVSKSGDSLLLENNLFDIRLMKSNDTKTIDIYIGWLIKRPDHDHNNSPHIALKIPEKGVIESMRAKSEDAKLIIVHDSGHLGLELYFQDYVYSPPERVHMVTEQGKKIGFGV